MMSSQNACFTPRVTCARFLVLLAGVLAACSPQDDAADRNSEEGRKRRLPELQEVKVEVRKDGLAYLPGASLPFTGDAVSLHYDRTPPRLFVRTPYRDGKIDGVKSTYTSGGKLREERTYKNGTPVTCVVYHGNGQKKIELQLNSHDKGEGPYRRWHDNGQLEAESLLDSEERLHGEEKDYDRDGKLVGHYRNDHGRLVEVISESPELRAARLAKWGPSVPGDAPVKPAQPQP
jgi:hypothetical protein